MSLREFAKHIGITPSYASNLESGKRGLPSLKVLRKICQKTGANFEWLKSGVGNMTLHSEGFVYNYDIANPVHKEAKERMVPVVSWARAGASGFNYDDLGNHIDTWVSCDVTDPNAFALILEGDSMEPDYQAGDIVVFLPNSEPRNGDVVVARHQDSGSVYFKKFKRSGLEGMTAKLISLNPNYSDIELPIDEFRFIYPASKLIRNLRAS